MKRPAAQVGKLFSIVIWIGISAGAASGAAPKVIQAVPDNGATNVDPGLREIRVTFDQDMKTDRYSWVGGGPTFPELRGRPRWIDARTNVLGVTLQPDHKYWLSINSVSHRNFQSKAGAPAVPYVISFTTGPGKGPRPAGLTPEANRLAIAELRRTIDENYSYRDLRKVDWEALWKRHAPAMQKATSAERFAAEAAKLLAPAKDIHIWLRVGEKTIPTFRRGVTPAYSLQTLAKVVPGWRKDSDCVWRGRFDDGIGYILIADWSSEHRDALEMAFEALDDFLDARALIIDVRPNSGGSEMLARHFAGCFVDKPAVYAKHVNRHVGAPGGFTQPHERVLRPKKGRPKYRGKVAVLMGAENMSSCEGFLLMMRKAPNCKLIGQRSYGASGNPKPTHLGNGVTVYLPSWKAMLPDGSVFEGQGIAPDISVSTTPAALQKRDPILQAALEHLRKP